MERQSTNYFREGLVALRRKPGVALIVWAVQAIVAFVVVLPLADAFSEIDMRGFGEQMARHADIALLMESAPGAAIRRAAINLLWAIPLVGVINSAMAVGIVNAVRDGGLRSFWDGIGRFGGKAIPLAFVYVALAFGVHAVIQIPVLLVVANLGDKASILVGLTVWPLVTVVASAILDCMHDYSRIELVVRGKSIVRSLGGGLAWPFRHPSSLALYTVWMVIAIVVTLSPLVLENVLPAATGAGLVLLVLLQQLMFVVRAGVTVAWYGSEVTYFEERAEAELPLIAADEYPEISEQANDLRGFTT